MFKDVIVYTGFDGVLVKAMPENGYNFRIICASKNPNVIIHYKGASICSRSCSFMTDTGKYNLLIEDIKHDAILYTHIKIMEIES